MSRLSTESYWDDTYTQEHELMVGLDGFRNTHNQQIYASMEGLDFGGKKVIEIGAGDSQWLPFLAQRHGDAEFTGLDYSEPGVIRLKDKAKKMDLAIDAIHADIFDPPSPTLNTYDIALSFGVVEHFEDLSEVVEAVGGTVKPGGEVYSVIPNMAGSIGRLAKWMSMEVYAIHNPHDLQSLEQGHREAGLQIVESGYLGSLNFNVLSSCVNDSTSSKMKLAVYKFLSRVTGVVWRFESRFFELPKSAFLSPYIYCIARKPENPGAKIT